MERGDAARAKWQAFCEKAKPGFQKAGTVCRKTGDVLGVIWKYIYRYRKLFMAAPVVVAALYLARYSAGVLPETVGIFIQSNGLYAWTISRTLAVWAPVGITGLCLVLMFCSRRALYPWIISLFSLVLPFFMMISIFFPV